MVSVCWTFVEKVRAAHHHVGLLWVVATKSNYDSSMRRFSSSGSTKTTLSQAGALMLLVLFLVGCATSRNVGQPGLDNSTGIASYYASKFVGRPTANGEVFTQEALTAAHRTLPFGTRVRVTRLDQSDEPSVVVRINDRGPFKKGRVIDLTRAAARHLNMIQDGLANVRLKIVSYPDGVKVASDQPRTGGW